MDYGGPQKIAWSIKNITRHNYSAPSLVCNNFGVLFMFLSRIDNVGLSCFYCDLTCANPLTKMLYIISTDTCTRNITSYQYFTPLHFLPSESKDNPRGQEQEKLPGVL